MNPPATITKVLTPNDIGDTGSHQAGICVPKAPEILRFFPALNPREKNPRVRLWFREDDGLTRWEFVFIYYNNRFFGGTRNEYRLTCMTQYLRAKNAKVGEDLVFSRDSDARYFVAIRRATTVSEDDGVLRLTGGWKVIHIA